MTNSSIEAVPSGSALPRPELSDRVPDANAIWVFGAALPQADAIDALFRRRGRALRSDGDLAINRRIVDARIKTSKYDYRRRPAFSLATSRLGREISNGSGFICPMTG